MSSKILSQYRHHLIRLVCGGGGTSVGSPPADPARQPSDRPPAQAEIVTVDRPFIFVIRDIATDSILFAGRVLDPTS